MRLTDPLMDECLCQWPAWQTLVEHVTVGVDASVVDPFDVAKACDELTVEGWFRLSYLMVGRSHADTPDEAVDFLAELRALAIQGKRPRFAVEAGLTMDAFEAVRPDAS